MMYTALCVYDNNIAHNQTEMFSADHSSNLQPSKEAFSTLILIK